MLLTRATSSQRGSSLPDPSISLITLCNEWVNARGVARGYVAAESIRQSTRRKRGLMAKPSGGMTRRDAKGHILKIMQMVSVEDPSGYGGGGSDDANKMDQAINYLQDLLDRQNAAAGRNQGGRGHGGPKSPGNPSPKPRPKPGGVSVPQKPLPKRRGKDS